MSEHTKALRRMGLIPEISNAIDSLARETAEDREEIQRLGMRIAKLEAGQGKAADPETPWRAIHRVDITLDRTPSHGPTPPADPDPALVEEMAKAYSDEAPRHGPFRGAVRPEVVTAHTACMARVLALLVAKGWGPAGSAEEIARLKAELDVEKRSGYTATGTRLVYASFAERCENSARQNAIYAERNALKSELDALKAAKRTRPVTVRKLTLDDMREARKRGGFAVYNKGCRLDLEAANHFGWVRRVGPKS